MGTWLIWISGNFWNGYAQTDLDPAAASCLVYCGSRTVETGTSRDADGRIIREHEDSFNEGFWSSPKKAGFGIAAMIWKVSAASINPAHHY
jgi:hypothetical protein